MVGVNDGVWDGFADGNANEKGVGMGVGARVRIIMVGLGVGNGVGGKVGAGVATTPELMDDGACVTGTGISETKVTVRLWVSSRACRPLSTSVA